MGDALIVRRKFQPSYKHQTVNFRLEYNLAGSYFTDFTYSSPVFDTTTSKILVYLENSQPEYYAYQYFAGAPAFVLDTGVNKSLTLQIKSIGERQAIIDLTFTYNTSTRKIDVSYTLVSGGGYNGSAYWMYNIHFYWLA